MTLTLRGNGKPPAAEVEEGKDAPPRLVLSFAGVRPATTALTNIKKCLVDRVRVAANGTPGSTRVVLEMTGQYAYRVQPDAVNGRNVVVTIGDPAALGTTPADFTLAKAAGTSSAPAATATVRTPAAPVTRTTRTEPTVAGAQGRRHVAAPLHRPPDQPRLPGRRSSARCCAPSPRSPASTWSSIPRSGVVDVSLHEVPWDHALDIILRANQLDYTVEGRSSASPRSRRCARKVKRAASWPRSRRSPVSW